MSNISRQNVCVFTCISSSVQTFLSIFKLRTFEMLGPSPLCSPETNTHTYKSNTHYCKLTTHTLSHTDLHTGCTPPHTG